MRTDLRYNELHGVPSLQGLALGVSLALTALGAAVLNGAYQTVPVAAAVGIMFLIVGIHADLITLTRTDNPPTKLCESNMRRWRQAAGVSGMAGAAVWSVGWIDGPTHYVAIALTCGALLLLMAANINSAAALVHHASYRKMSGRAYRVAKRELGKKGSSEFFDTLGLTEVWSRLGYNAGPMQVFTVPAWVRFERLSFGEPFGITLVPADRTDGIKLPTLRIVGRRWELGLIVVVGTWHQETWKSDGEIHAVDAVMLKALADVVDGPFRAFAAGRR